MIYAFYTKDSEKKQIIEDYFATNYSTTILETEDIDWGRGSNQSKYYTFYSIDPIIDLSQSKLDLRIPIIKLNGNSFYTEEVYVPKLEDYTGYIQNTLENKAKEYKYDNIISACSYINSSNTQFKNESIAFNAWRDYLWGPVLDQLKLDLANGNPPDVEQFIANLPTFESYLNI